MSKSNIISVWKALLSENTDAAKNAASEYINETAARILKDILKEEGEFDNISAEVTDTDDIDSDAGDTVIVSYSDPEADCNFDDDVISVSGKDDYDMAGWKNGKRYLSFIYNTPEEANEYISRIGDLADTIDDLSVSSSQPEAEEIEDTTVEDPESDIDSTSETEVEENTYSGSITVTFPSDGDDTVVNDLRDRGFDIEDTEIDDEGNRVIHISASEDAVPEIEQALNDIGVSNYNIDSEEKNEIEETEEEDTPDENSQDDGSDIADTITSVETSLEALKAELQSIGIDLSGNAEINGEGDEDSSEVTGLDEAFLGYEDVKAPKNKDLNDGKSPIISTPTKDRLKPASPIKSPAGTLTGDGTKAEPAPTVKDLPASKNTIKGNVKNTYTKVSKEGDTAAKLNSKDGFGEEGKNSIID